MGALGEAMGLIPGPLPRAASFDSHTAGPQDFVLTVKDGKRETDAEFYPLKDRAARIMCRRT